MNEQFRVAAERRSFFGILKSGAVALAALAAGNAAEAQESAKASDRYEAARHNKDEWLEIPAKHRVVFDTTSLAAAGEAISFANNFLVSNRNDYGLQNRDLSVVIVVRHNSAPFGYSDSMWAKYGAPLAARTGNEDPKTKQAPKVNLLNSTDYGDLLLNRGLTLDALTKQGVQLAVCGMSTRANAAFIAKALSGDAGAIYNDLAANLTGGARIVPAGVVTVNRAQERGYTLFKT